MRALNVNVDIEKVTVSTGENFLGVWIGELDIQDLTEFELGRLWVFTRLVDKNIHDFRKEITKEVEKRGAKANHESGETRDTEEKQ